MSIRLNTSESPERITDPELLSIHKRREDACLELQKQLNEGFYSLSDTVAKIERLTERVRSLGKKYQEEKHPSVFSSSLYAQQEEFLQELGGYKAIHIKTVLLIQRTQSTISYIEPAHLSRSDVKSLQENLPFYYAQLKLSESVFSKYAEQFKKTQSTLSNLNHQLSAAIHGKGLKMALERFNKIIEHQETPSTKRRLLTHISPSPLPRPRTPVILEQPRVPITSERRASISPLYQDPQPSLKSLPLSSIQKQSTLSHEFLCALSRGSNSGEPTPSSLQKKRPSTSSQEMLDQSSPRMGTLSASREIRQLISPRRFEISPRNIPLHLSPRELGRGPLSLARREATSRLIQSDSSSPREKPISLTSSSPRDRHTRFIHTAEPSVPTHQISREPRRTLLPSLNRKYEQDTPPPERGRRLYPRKTYENVGASYLYSGSHY